MIKKFCVNKLFGNKDITITFYKKTTILIGENGIGKTTILAMLFYALTDNIESLSKFDFESITIIYNDEKEITIEKNDVFEHIEQKNNRATKTHRRYAEEIKNCLSDKEINMIFIEEDDDSLKKLYFKVRDKIRMTNRAFQLGVEYLKHNSAEFNVILELKECNNNYFKNTKILYFPTFRRIEEDVMKIKNQEEYIFDFEDVFEESEENYYGELIQFGMEDVKKRIDDLLNIIKNDSLDSFNTMTSKLLSQYLSNDFSNIDNLKTTEKNVIEIALNRVGSKISENTRNHILEMVNEDTLLKNQYLANLVMNIVDNYLNLQSIDERIKVFVNKCNDYLYNKELIYDPSKVTLKITSKSNNKKEIPLEKLSSGEKQLVSTFSKVYLEDTDKLIILFDEPELSLSIEWQKKFIYDISQSDNVSFLMAVTHSPFIVSELINNTYELEYYSEEVD